MKKSIYIFNNGELKRKDNTFYFYREDGEKNYLPIENIHDIFVMGEVKVTKKFLELMTKKKIILHFFNYHGYYTGSYYPREHYNSGYMILKQSTYYNDDEKRMDLAQKFVTGSFENILKVLKYYNNRIQSNIDKVITKINNLKNKIESTSSTSELMAVEGNARAYYYQTFDDIIKNDRFTFERRSKRPPQNQLNALISFGNSMLYVTILGEVYKTHLDPRIGFLHSTNSRSFTLNLDLSEIFKPIIVDRIIFKLLNKNIIGIDDFVDKTGGILLSEKGRKAFVKEFDNRLNTTIKHRKLDRHVSYRRLFRLELYKIQKHLMGEEEYIPYVSRW